MAADARGLSSTLVLRAEVTELLGDLSMPRRAKRLRFTVSRHDGLLGVESSLGGSAVLADLIGGSPLLMDQLRAATEEGSAVTFEVEVRNGRAKRTTLKVTM